VRAAVSAEADQVEGLRALGELGRQLVLEHQRLTARTCGRTRPGYAWQTRLMVGHSE
jgi:hypothetical protein